MKTMQKGACAAPAAAYIAIRAVDDGVEPDADHVAGAVAEAGDALGCREQGPVQREKK